MNTNIKNIAVTFTFVTLITGMMLANIIAPDKEFSFSERRLLAVCRISPQACFLTTSWLKSWKSIFWTNLSCGMGSEA